MKVLLLGSTGLLGHNVLSELLLKGYEVNAVVRHADNLRLTDSTGRLTVVESSLGTENLRNAARGCDAIINCAGTTDMSLRNYSDYMPVNATLCEELLQLMDELGIRTLVHVSSANTVGYGNEKKPGTEQDDMKDPFTHSYYAKSKKAGETILLWAAMEHPDYHIVILNPGFMIGPYDVKPSSGKLLLAAKNKPLMAVPRGGKSFVDVRDVARAVVTALTKGGNGERYLLTGTDMSLRDFYVLQASVCGYKQHLMTLPDWVVLLAGKIGDFLRYLGIATQLSTRNVKQLCIMENYSCDKAREALDYRLSPVNKAIEDFFAWENSNRESKSPEK